jgi:hypothetical protein
LQPEHFHRDWKLKGCRLFIVMAGLVAPASWSGGDKPGYDDFTTTDSSQCQISYYISRGFPEEAYAHLDAAGALTDAGGADSHAEQIIERTRQGRGRERSVVEGRFGRFLSGAKNRKREHSDEWG